jgi:DnaJ-class molecular chaperone
MLDVVIPKGASEGQVIRLKGQGAPGRNGQSGDALIELKIAPHAIFRRDGADLTMDLPISVPDAVLGGKIPVPTPEGVVMMTIPKGSNSGKTLRLKGRGAHAGGQRGDLLARLIVTLPEEPDEQLIRFATEWREKRGYAPGGRRV